MEMLCIVKKVLVMSVNPGNAGQMYLPYVGKKITKLLSMKEDMDFEIYWDGACSADKILEYAPKGVAGFVLGTTLLFGKDKPYGETLQDIRELKGRNRKDRWRKGLATAPSPYLTFFDTSFILTSKISVIAASEYLLFFILNAEF